jgi:hypothetical protein
VIVGDRRLARVDEAAAGNLIEGEWRRAVPSDAGKSA